MAGFNDTVIAAWNTVLFDKFCRFKHLLVDGLAALRTLGLVEAGGGRMSTTQRAAVA